MVQGREISRGLFFGTGRAIKGRFDSTENRRGAIGMP